MLKFLALSYVLGMIAYFLWIQFGNRIDETQKNKIKRVLLWPWYIWQK
jgi:hypothetical protein